ncbi:hypothetical protein D6T63_04200 [Arthrobacter cheniae]|uniref:Uncharacterized protein n=1 Tax=Arthrobacter cheniae TaxID=1258888 RepID=A0A3A5MH43_9MICC|nr:hypothetical protein [Arthrobacter cheniae]RJT81956.1 hypothetical protein D6T63_04200 [Arthrobacter cheniae]
MESGGWDALSAIATLAATLVALWILGRDIILRRQDEQRREKDARDRRVISLLEEVLTTLLGRERVRSSRIAMETSEEANRQYRAELKLPVLIAQIPRQYTILLRRSEPSDTINIDPHEWAIGIDPWRTHEAWGDRLPFPGDLLAADILASIEALATGQPKKYPVAPDA